MVFAYKKMSLGLKTARSIYQRLVKWVFKHQIWQNVKVYVNDIVIKSRFSLGLKFSSSCPDEPLYLYLTTSSRTINAVLIQKRGKKKKPVYCVSRGLQNAETWYHPIERATLALVKVANKLKPYFQLLVIRVLTNLPLKQVL